MASICATNTADRETLKHLDIILALCRTALGSGSPIVAHHVERLREALEADGDQAAAGRVARLLTAEQRDLEMSVSRLKRSSAVLSAGEALTANAPVPVDRETASPLAEIIPVDKLPSTPPIFNELQQSALTALLEEWKFADALSERGVPPPRTCLLFGAPGTGKTALALWMARQLQLPVVLVRLDGLISSFLGTTSRNIGSLFSFASRYSCLLLLDEFDAIAKVRDDPHEIGEIKRVVNTLLQNLDQRNSVGLTIAITNHELLLDPAVWRRFEVQLSVPRPALHERERIVARYFDTMHISAAKTSFLAWLSEGLSGAEIEQLALGLRRSLALAEAHPGSDFTFLEAVQQYVLLNNGRLHDRIASAVLSRPEDLAKTLLNEASIGVTDIGDILNVSKGTASRYVHKPLNDKLGRKVGSGA
jgi:SpoVK/Ycf46/Vps4 family AAA+-type ATPase